MNIELLDSKDHAAEDIKTSIRDIISSNQLLSMATADGEDPHINTAFYAFDEELNFYILTPPDTRHGQNLEENHSVAVDIHDSNQEWTDDKQGVQMFGKAERMENPSRALDLYIERFPKLEEFASTAEELEDLDSRFYRIEIEKIKVFDEPRFGSETWITVEVK